MCAVKEPKGCFDDLLDQIKKLKKEVERLKNLLKEHMIEIFEESEEE